jgi:hypothetical protein
MKGASVTLCNSRSATNEKTACLPVAARQSSCRRDLRILILVVAASSPDFRATSVSVSGNEPFCWAFLLGLRAAFVRVLRVDQRNEIFHPPKAVRIASGHGGRPGGAQF